MKKFLLIFGCAFLLSTYSYSQAVEQGMSLVDVAYGWPNLWTTTLKSITTTTESYNVKVSGIGPMSLRYEYMVADKVGVGLMVSYASTGITFSEDTYDGLGNPVTYDYDFKIPRYRVMPKFSFHYGNSDMFDGFTTIAVGYGGYSFNWTSNDPSITDDYYDWGFWPVAVRVATGGRIFFSDNVGALLEFGLGGGGLLEFGLCAKF